MSNMEDVIKWCHDNGIDKESYKIGYGDLFKLMTQKISALEKEVDSLKKDVSFCMSVSGRR